MGLFFLIEAMMASAAEKPEPTTSRGSSGASELVLLIDMRGKRAGGGEKREENRPVASMTFFALMQCVREGDIVECIRIAKG